MSEYKTETHFGSLLAVFGNLCLMFFNYVNQYSVERELQQYIC